MEAPDDDPGSSLVRDVAHGFAFAGLPAINFWRSYRPHDDRIRAFGMGHTDSFDIFPVGDSQTFSYMELVLPTGGSIHFDRTSSGTGYTDAKYRARTYIGSPFSRSTMEWKDSGWDLHTQDGWTYRFPSSGPGRTWQQSALIGIRSDSGQTFTIARSNSGDLQKIVAPDGTTIEFVCDARHRIISATSSAGRTLHYEYDDAGHLIHVHDSDTGDEYYEYDKVNQMTRVLDGQHRPLLVNDYGYVGELRSQTLADGSKMVYESGYDDQRRLEEFKATLPNGYSIQWMNTRNGFVAGLPAAAPQRARRSSRSPRRPQPRAGIEAAPPGSPAKREIKARRRQKQIPRRYAGCGQPAYTAPRHDTHLVVLLSSEQRFFLFFAW